MKRIFDIIYKANPRRSLDNLGRRMEKIMEELGEATAARLNVTSELNAKGSTWEDLREELLDVIIIATDCLYTPMPIDEGKTREEIEAEMFEEFKRKMAKWEKQIKEGKDVTLN